jgi:hypothetical protein
VRILTPAHPIQATSAATTDIAGDAADQSGIAAVNWTVNSGTKQEASGAATGTTQWAAAGIPLRVGTNRVIVTATSTAGAENQDAVDIVRTS